MLNFNRGSDRPADLPDPRNAGKPALRPAAVYEPPGSVPSPPTVRALLPDPAPHRDGHPGVARHESAHASTPPASNVATASAPGIGSTLHVGVNIKLKGVEISDCGKVSGESNRRPVSTASEVPGSTVTPGITVWPGAP